MMSSRSTASRSTPLSGCLRSDRLTLRRVSPCTKPDPPLQVGHEADLGAHAHKPVIGVNWYDARDYCRWVESGYRRKRNGSSRHGDPKGGSTFGATRTRPKGIRTQGKPKWRGYDTWYRRTVGARQDSRTASTTWRAISGNGSLTGTMPRITGSPRVIIERPFGRPAPSLREAPGTMIPSRYDRRIAQATHPTPGETMWDFAARGTLNGPRSLEQAESGPSGSRGIVYCPLLPPVAPSIAGESLNTTRRLSPDPVHGTGPAPNPAGPGHWRTSSWKHR